MRAESMTCATAVCSVQFDPSKNNVTSETSERTIMANGSIIYTTYVPDHIVM